jgi:hypothetical protein
MKTTLQKPVLCLLVGFGLMLTSCHQDFIVIEKSPSSPDPNLFMSVYMTKKDFSRGNGMLTRYYQDQTYRFIYDTLLHIETDYNYWEGQQIPLQNKGLYFDVRNSQGFSTWSKPFLTLTSDNGINLTIDYLPSNQYGFNYFYIWDGDPTTPPAHLHLCLHSWDENPQGKVPSKTWKVTRIYDDQGIDLTTDPDWTNYEDNVITFEKVDRFIIDLGTKRSQKERDLFKTEKSVFGTYSVSKVDDTVVLNLVFPTITGNANDVNASWMSKLTVLASDWTSLKLAGELAGKKGTLELVPIN